MKKYEIINNKMSFEISDYYSGYLGTPEDSISSDWRISNLPQ